jgi:hypothetical protein
MPPEPQESVLWHQSGVAPDGTPFVQLIRNDKIIAQMGVDQARDHAAAMLEACEAAEQDAFIMDFGREVLGLPLPEAGSILMALREYRAKRTGKSQGPTNPRDWVMPDKLPHYPGVNLDHLKPKRPPEDDFTKKDPK